MSYSYSNAALQKEDRESAAPVEQTLPLVIEIIPGQAAEGLINIFDPGSFEGKPLKSLVIDTLNRMDWSLEERQILEDVLRQLQGGRILWKGQDIKGPATDYAVIQHTDAGEKYLYAQVRVIKPQEGGARF